MQSYLETVNKGMYHCDYVCTCNQRWSYVCNDDRVFIRVPYAPNDDQCAICFEDSDIIDEKDDYRKNRCQRCGQVWECSTTDGIFKRIELGG